MPPNLGTNLPMKSSGFSNEIYSKPSSFSYLTMIFYMLMSTGSSSNALMVFYVLSFRVSSRIPLIILSCKSSLFYDILF